jgi:hypothetical protein
MAIGKWHNFWGFMSYLLFGGIVFYFEVFSDSLLNLVAIITVGIFLAMSGATLADIDHQIGWLSHRDITTHSALLPTLAVLPQLYLIYIGDTSNVFFMLYPLPFALAYGTHLLLDLFPTFDPEKVAKQKGVIEATMKSVGAIVQGISSKEIVSKMSGSYRVMFPIRIFGYKSLGLHKTRFWLFFHGLYCFIISGVIFYVALQI